MRVLPSLLLVTAACAGARQPASDDPSAVTPVRAPARRASNVITRDELLDPSLSGSTVLEAVRRLRPTFLASRGAISVRDPTAGTVRVSIDGGTVGPLEELERIHTTDVRSIRYLSASDATQRFGIATGGSPVILVERM